MNKKPIAMQSMGNWTPPPKDESWLGTITETATSLYEAAKEKAGLTDPNAVDWNDREIYTRQGNTGGSGYAGASAVGSYGGQQAPTLFNKKKKRHRRPKGGVGGQWADDDGSQEESSEEQPQHQSSAPLSVQAGPPPVAAAEPVVVHSEQAVAEAAQLEGSEDSSSDDSEDGSLERRAVDDIAHHGLRAAPTEAELAEFLNRARGLDAKAICGALNEKLTETDAQIRLKALVALKALLDNKVKHVRSYVKKHPLPVVNLTVDTTKKVQSTASQIVKKVWSKGGAPAPQGAVPSTTAPKAATSLFDDVPSSHVAPAAQSQQPNLLFGLQPNPAPQQPAQNLLFSNSVAPQQPAVQQQQQQQQQPQHQQQAAAPGTPGGQKSGDLASLLSGINLNAPNLQFGTTMVSSPPAQYQQPQYPAQQQYPVYTQPAATATPAAASSDPFGSLWNEVKK